MSDDVRRGYIEEYAEGFKWIDDPMGEVFIEWEDYDRLSQTVRDLEQRLAERDKELVQAKADLKHSLWFNRASIWVSRDQINAAWEYRNADPNGYAEAALACFSIVACEECGGSGNVHGISEYGDRPETDVCHVCDGHGWVWVMETK